MANHGGAWALELLTEQISGVDRGLVRRSFYEIVDVMGGKPTEAWWRWCVETGASLGLKLKVVDCTPAEAVELAREGANLITLSPGVEAEWIVLFGNPHKRIPVARSLSPAQREVYAVGRLRRMLASVFPDQKLRCVVFEPGMVSTPQRETTRKSTKPLSRLRQILGPEWSDIWIVIIFAFVVGLLTLTTPIAVEALVNTVAFGGFLQPVIVLAIVLFTFLAFSAAIRALQTYVVEIIQQRLFARVAADLAYRLPRTHIERTEHHYMPELVNRFFDVVTVQKVSAQLLLDGVGLLLSTLIGMLVLAFYHPWLLGFDLMLMASVAFLILVLGRGAIASSIKESKMKYYMAEWLEDIARCPITFRTDGGNDFAMERADHLIQDYLSARQKHFRVLLRQILFSLGLQAIASTVLLGLGGWLVVSGELTLGQLVAAELIVTVIVSGFAKLGKHMESFYDLLASVDKLGVLFDLPHEREEGVLALGDRTPIAVEADSVTYARPGGKPMMGPISFHIEPRQSFALVGSSGSGKSTLLDMFYALRNPTTGTLAINGFDPADMRPDLLRRNVALVRGAEVFHGTIAENVHLHRPEVSSNHVRDALKYVGLLEPVLLLEESLETLLTSAGHPLTETQCRLLGLARAIAGHPSFLLVDGILDSLSDEELPRVLENLLQPDLPWTLLIATGREDIAKRCHQQYRLLGSQPA